jgi:hypothetical protein
VIVALLVVLAVNLALLVAALAVVVLRRRAVKGEPGAFKGKIRVAEGEVDGLSANWSSGYGHWVRDILVWNKAPFLLRTKLVAVEAANSSGIHAVGPRNGEQLRADTMLVPLLVHDESRIDVAVATKDREDALGPFAHAAAVGSLVKTRLTPRSTHWQSADE